MQRDGLCTLAKSGQRRGLLTDYLTAVAQAVESGEHDDEAIRAADMLDERVEERPRSAPYTATRLELLRANDRDEWAYVLAAALNTGQQETWQRLQASSPWPIVPLLFVHYGCTFLGTLVCSINTTADMAKLADELIGAVHATYAADSYLVIIKPDPEIYWLECGLCGVKQARDPSHSLQRSDSAA